MKFGVSEAVLSGLLIGSCMLFLQVFPLWAQNSAVVANQNNSSNTYYRDCSQVNIKPVDEANLTKQELLTRKYAALLEALDDNAQCMEDAFASGQAAQQAAAGGQGTSQNSAAANGTSNNQNNANAQANSSSTQQSPSNQRASGAANQVITGVQAGPCALYKELLKEATTDDEKNFYKEELSKYQCS